MKDSGYVGDVGQLLTRKVREVLSEVMTLTGHLKAEEPGARIWGKALLANRAANAGS